MADIYENSIFCATVDDTVKTELLRRSNYYTSNNVYTGLFDWTTNKTAYVTATAKVEVNNKVISSATLDNNKTGGGLFAVSDNRIYKKYNTDIKIGTNSVGSFLPTPIIKSAHIYSYGDLGELYECRIEFTLFSQTDLINYSVFFEIGGKLNVNYGWTKVGGSCNKGNFEGIISNFSYNLTQDGSYECFTDAIGPGTNILLSNINSNTSTISNDNIISEDGKGDTQSSICTGIAPEIIKRINTVGTSAPENLQQNGILYLPSVNEFDKLVSRTDNTSTNNTKKEEDIEPPDNVYDLCTENDVYVPRNLLTEYLNSLVGAYCKNDLAIKQNDKNASSYKITINGKNKLVDLKTYNFRQLASSVQYTDDKDKIPSLKDINDLLDIPVVDGEYLIAKYEKKSNKLISVFKIKNPTISQLANCEILNPIDSPLNYMEGADNIINKNMRGISDGMINKDANISIYVVELGTQGNAGAYYNEQTKQLTLKYLHTTHMDANIVSATVSIDDINDNNRSVLKETDIFQLRFIPKIKNIYDKYFVNIGKVNYDVSIYDTNTLNAMETIGINTNGSYVTNAPARNYYIQFKHLIEIINLKLLNDSPSKIYFDSPKNSKCFETNETFTQNNTQNNINSDLKYNVVPNTLPSDGCLLYFDGKSDGDLYDSSTNTILFVSPDPKTMIYPYPFATYNDIDLNCKNVQWGYGGYNSASDILFNCDAITKLLISTGSTTNTVDTNVRNDIMSFLKNIFNIINLNSGTRFKLNIRQSDKYKNYYVIYSMNDSYAYGGTISTTEIHGVTNGSYLRNVNFSSDVPDSVASMVGIQNSAGQFITTNNTNAAAVGRLFFNGITGTRTDANTMDSINSTKEKNRDAAITTFKNAFVHLVKSSDDDSDIEKQSAYNMFVGALRSAITTLFQIDAYEHYPALIPVHFTFTIDGIHGFKFGDCVTFNYVPNLYKPSNRVFFNIIKIDHKIQDNDWVTEVDTILRYMPNTQCTVKSTHTQRPYIKAQSISVNEYAPTTINFDEFSTEIGNVTTHYTINDLLKTNYATENQPDTDDEKNSLIALVRVLNIIAAAAEENNLGRVFINSGYRNAYVNKKVNGSNESQHKKGEAADLTLNPKENNVKLFYLIQKLAKDKKIEFDQLMWEMGTDEYPAWVHISYKSLPSRGENRYTVDRILSDKKGTFRHLYKLHV